MKKQKVFLLLFSFLIMFTIGSVFAETTSINGHKVGVHDLANVLSDVEENELMSLGIDASKELGIDIVFLTTYDTNGKSSMTYSDDFYDGIEGPTTYGNDGILFFIDLDNDMNYVNTTGTAIKNISDYEVDKILDAAAEADLDDYIGCMENMLYAAIDSYKTSGYTDEIYDNNPFMIKNIASGLIGMVILDIILLFIHSKANRKTKASHYLENGDIIIHDKNTRYVRTYQDVQRGYYKSSSSSSGGGSSHRSSSGRSHGGGGRHR